jgi:hypothetical protein
MHNFLWGHYNKKCLYMPSDFTGLMNIEQRPLNEFIGLNKWGLVGK